VFLSSYQSSWLSLSFQAVGTGFEATLDVEVVVGFDLLIVISLYYKIKN
jgi:hypothetical protein